MVEDEETMTALIAVSVVLGFLLLVLCVAFSYYMYAKHYHGIGWGKLGEEETGESDGGPVLEANTDSDGDGSDGGLVLEANSA